MFGTFRQRVVITKPASGGGAQAADGSWVVTPNVAQTETIYDDMADVQDLLKTEQKTEQGTPTSLANALVFLYDESGIDDISTDHRMEIQYENGKIEQATILDIRRIDGALVVQRLRTA